MKPHPRIRKTIKWGGAVVTVLLVVVWVASGWIHPAQPMGVPQITTWIAHGCVVLHEERGEWLATYAPRNPFEDDVPELARWELLPWLQHGMFSRTVGLPLWIPAAAFFVLTVQAWHLDTLARRRARLNRCPKCGYDRTGLATKDAKCPECGAAPLSVEVLFCWWLCGGAA